MEREGERERRREGGKEGGTERARKREGHPKRAGSRRARTHLIDVEEPRGHVRVCLVREPRADSRFEVNVLPGDGVALGRRGGARHAAV
eukprot:5013873-Pleurochrysis_carterae.AAC.1